MNTLPRYILCLFVASALSLEAAEYYTATNGSDGATGSIESPFATIQRGIDVLAPGDTLFIRGGHYHESVTITGLAASSNSPTV